MLVALLALACTRPDPDGPATDPDDETTSPSDSGTPPAPATPFEVLVLLDGQPAPDVRVLQPGTALEWRTGADGRVAVDLDLEVQGELYVVASHPDARILGGEPPRAGEALTIELERFDRSDNPDYVFQDPGTPDRRGTTGQCAHCHGTIDDDWYASPHRSSASNPTVQAVYADAVPALAGGPEPFGGCADCHAPGIDGVLGGRDLAEADGFALEAGVHCDVCHKVEAIDPAAPEPGVAGKLKVLRPSEPPPSPALGPFHPLTFGPYPDVPHIRMGSVHREHFEQAAFCAGCHQHDQEVLVPGEAADPARWPDGRLPIHSTYAEWLAGPFNPAAPCTSCHMPPDPSVGNSADLGNSTVLEPGVTGGWYRPPGSVRRHTWVGPRQRDSGMLELAATLTVDEQWAKDELVVSVTVANVGPGHAIPTGEPLRSLVLLVQAACAGVPQPAVGGDAVPDFGGALERKEAGDDWTRWATAAPGDVVRVVRRTGAWHDYTGFGPFGDGTFDAVDKGMPVEQVVGSVRVVSVAGGVATFDAPLPAGDVAYLGRDEPLPADGDPAAPRAGAPGFAFARVLVGPDGSRMVPHPLAVDVASDNRILPGAEVTTTHRFLPSCADPEVTAVLVHRALPLDLGPPVVESVMARVQR